MAACGGNDGLWDWDLATNRIRFSRRWVASLGCAEHEWGDTPEEWFRRIHPEDVRQVQLAIDAHLAGRIPEIDNQHRIRHVDGTYRWMHCRGRVVRNEAGLAVRLTGSHVDLTAEKVTDVLTGLPNSFLLLDRVARSIDRAHRHTDFLFALLLINLDHFSLLVEHSGQAAGDHLLITAARRLETSLRAWNSESHSKSDYVVAHLKGDEFAVLLENLTEVGEAKTVAERLLKEIAAPLKLDGHEVFPSASVGMALSLSQYNDPEAVLSDADTAMRRAKSLGKGRCEVFDTAVLESTRKRLQLEAELREAIELKEFRVRYQPIVSLDSSRIAGFETLVRWHHPARGVVYPNEFIPVAESTGIIVPLGQWVLREACSQLKAWQELPGTPGDLWVSVNISGVQLKQPAIVETVGKILSDTGLDPHCLMLELTESTAMENPETVTNILLQLRVMGVRLGLDDFGTGFSALGNLPRFPVDCLKIERSFVHGMLTSKDMVGVVRTIHELAHQLGLQVIVEGIEKTEQLNLVRALECEYGQGFLFSKPIDSEKATELVKVGVHPFPGTEGDEVDATLCAAESDRSAGESPGLAVADQGAGKREGSGFIPKRRALFIVMATLLLILAGGLVIRFRPTSPATSTRFPQGELPPTSETLRDPERLQPTAAKPSVQEIQKPSAQASPAPAPVAPKPVRKTMVPSVFSVIHRHLVGNCKGVLEISGDTLSFISEKLKDGFELKYDEFTSSISDDYLIIKSGSKTYRFKSATAANKDDNRSELQSMIRLMSEAASHAPGSTR